MKKHFRPSEERNAFAVRGLTAVPTLRNDRFRLGQRRRGAGGAALGFRRPFHHEAVVQHRDDAEHGHHADQVAAFTSDSLDFSQCMLAETGVAATPGLDFDPARGRHFMRFSFAGSTADMAEAARRLKAWHNKAKF